MKTKEKIFVLFILVVVVFTTRMIGKSVIHIYDDAYITFRYAKNLANGKGFVYNEGEKILGTTSPLFGLIQTAVCWEGGNLPKIVPLMNMLFDSLTVIIVFFCLWQKDIIAATVFGLIFSAEMWIVRISVGGMEMSLFTLISFLGIYLFSIKKKKTGIFLAGLSFFLRPEGIILTGVLSLLSLLVPLKEGGWRQWKKMGIILIPFFTIVLPTMIIWGYYGSPISQSVFAKSEMIGENLLQIVKRQYLQNAFHWAILPFVVIGAWKILSEREEFPTIVLCWGFLYSLAYIIGRPQMWSWYLFPIYAIKFFVASIGMAEILEIFLPDYKKIIKYGSIAIIAMYSLVFLKKYPSETTKKVYTPMERYCSANIATGKTILAEDIGAIGFYSDAYIYDVAGLVLKKELRGKKIEEIIREEKPDLILLNASTYNERLMEKIREDYLPKKYWPPSEEGGLQKGWTQKYILFEKR